MGGFLPRTRVRLLAAGMLTAALVASAAATPARAQEQPLAQACAEVEIVPGTCSGATKLAERAAAECRRRGLVPDESCTGPMGRRVVRSEVKAHESSWLHRTLAFQYELGNALPLRDAPWAGTHNSFNSPSEETTLSSTDSNQQLSITDQLRIDMRSLELDVHWNRSPRSGGEPAPVVCHARGASEFHAGCTTERLLPELLAEIAAWLRAHDDQVLLLYVEDNVDTAEGYDPTARVLGEGLRDANGKSLIYKPPSGGACTDLPLDLTRDEVLDAGRQVLIVSGCGQGAAWRGLVFDWNDVEVEERNHGYRDRPTCDQDPDGDGRPSISPGEYASKLVRYYEDSTWLSQAASNVGLASPDQGLSPEVTRRLVRCGVELIGFDQILPTDGRLEALAWSWARNEPSRSDGCAIQRGDGRWVSRRCTKVHQVGCRRADGRWAVTLAAVQRAAAGAACRNVSGTPALPRSGAQNAALREAARAAGADVVWLGI
jgi:hypothetical protein